MSARILVVDDILPNVKLLEAKLTNEYYEVFTAMNGPDALEMAAAERPDIILLDIMMPGMDGFEVCQRLKADPDLAHIPVVMVTALTDPEDRVRGLEAGADDFLSKPINDTSLMARVRSLVRLKMAMDEWRVRENAASQLGIMDEFSASAMDITDLEGRLLIIEDKAFEQNKFQSSLEDHHEHVRCVKTGPEAIEILRNDEYDLILLSLDLADEDGLRLVSHFKSNERTRHIPIIMIGKQDDMKMIASGLEFGAHDYVVRPLDKNELQARARTQMRKKRYQERLRSSYEVSLSMALTDGLTKLYNRRYLEVHLEKLLQKNREDKKALAVLLMDIDHFKSVNDTHGHGVGDEVLQVFAERLREGVRGIDMIARYGGEEFVVVLPDVSQERAYRVAERLRANIANTPMPCAAEGGSLPITTSMGGAIIHGDEDGVTVRSALDRADKELYSAKDNGRNCIYFEHKGLLNPAELELFDPRGADAIEDV